MKGTKFLICCTILLTMLVSISCDEDEKIVDPYPLSEDNPEISTLSASSGYGGKILTITGENFNSNPSMNLIAFGSKVIIPNTASSNALDIMIPYGGSDAPDTIQIKVASNPSVKFSNTVNFIYPQILWTWLEGLSNPRGITFDSDGICYISDPNDGVILQVSPEGDVSTYAEIAAAADLSFDNDGNLWACDHLEGIVFKIPAGGGEAEEVTTEIEGPFSATFDDNGNAYICSNTGSITKIALDSRLTTLDIGGTKVLNIRYLNGFLYWTDREENTLSKAAITADGVGEAEEVFSDPAGAFIPGANGFDIDELGNIFVVGAGESDKLSVIKPDGTAEVVISLPTANNKFLSLKNGYAYITTAAVGAVYKVWVGN